MKQLTICTRRYNQQLEDFAACAKESGSITMLKLDWDGGLFSACFKYDHTRLAFVKELMSLLVDITVQENPIYQHSPKLQSIAYDLRKTPLYQAEQDSLAQFLKHSRVMHLEGYATFRMAQYREKLDMMSYTLIKKLKLNQQD
ncbi:MAG: hypothetical protein FWC92_01965 [Defluviitaleaceae bacterium]|nr:hypothetical protein [Defluviitaleaceae bacterium]